MVTPKKTHITPYPTDFSLSLSYYQKDTLKVYDSLAKGMYYNSLLPFLQEFPASQLYVTRTEDFVNNPSSSFQKLARFLGIQEQFFSERNFYGRMATQQQDGSDSGYDDLSVMILQQQSSGQQLQQLQQGYRPQNTPTRTSHHHQRLQQQRVPAMGLEDELQQQQDVFPVHSVTSPSSTITPASSSNLADSSDDHPALELSIRYRLEKLFKPLNQRLMELFESQVDFEGWDYDVDRG